MVCRQFGPPSNRISLSAGVLTPLPSCQLPPIDHLTDHIPLAASPSTINWWDDMLLGWQILFLNIYNHLLLKQTKIKRSCFLSKRKYLAPSISYVQPPQFNLSHKKIESSSLLGNFPHLSKFLAHPPFSQHFVNLHPACVNYNIFKRCDILKSSPPQWNLTLDTACLPVYLNDLGEEERPIQNHVKHLTWSSLQT